MLELWPPPCKSFCVKTSLIASHVSAPKDRRKPMIELSPSETPVLVIAVPMDRIIIDKIKFDCTLACFVTNSKIIVITGVNDFNICINETDR